MTWSEKLVKVYMDSRERVLKEIHRKMTWGYSTVQEKALLDAIDKELGVLNKETHAWAQAAVQESFLDGAMSTFKAVSPTLPLPAYSAFTGLHKQALGMLIHNSQSFLAITNNLIARQAQDKVREIGVAMTTRKFGENLTWKEMQKAMETELTADGFYTVPWRNGKGQMRVDSYAELVARTTTAEATNTGALNQAEEMDQYLVKLTSHNTTCKVCAPRQGRVYRTRDFPEGDERNAFPHISQGLPRWPTYKTVHPNCAHRAVVYVWGQKTDAEKRAAIAKAGEPFGVDPRSEAEIDRYNKAQKIRADRLRDRKQWEKYKARLGDNAPKSFSGFRAMKRADGENWGKLQAKYKAMGYYNRAVKNEPDITRKIKAVAKMTDMKPVGLSYKIKSQESYLRKVETNYSPDGNEYEIKDIVRYTLTASSKTLADKTLNSIDAFARSGYNTVEVKNTWLNSMNPYKGINTTVTAPNGQKFEMQYHTPESFELKNGEMHKLYEQWRLLSSGDPARKPLETEMQRLSASLKRPDGIERVK